MIVDYTCNSYSSEKQKSKGSLEHQSISKTVSTSTYFINSNNRNIRTMCEIWQLKFNNTDTRHYVKSVQIRSFFWSLFSCIWTEYGDLLRIQYKYKKLRTGKNSVFGHFSRSVHQGKAKKIFIFFFFILHETV